MEAFPNDNIEIIKHLTEKKLEKEGVSMENKMDTATLFDKHGNLCMPKILYITLTNAKPSSITGEVVLLDKQKLGYVGCYLVD